MRIKQRLLGVAASLAVLLCAAGWAGAQEIAKDSEEEAESLLSDTSGEIEEVVLQYSASLASEVIPTYRSFLQQLDENAVVHVVCESSVQVDAFRVMLDNWQIRNTARFKVVNANKEITVWARDRFVVKTAKDNMRRRIVVLPSLPQAECSDRVNDKEVPEIIAKSSGEEIETRQSFLFFEGGNLVTSDTHLFTGHLTLADPKLGSQEEALRRLEQEFGKKVIVIGSEKTPEPDYHIDMYLTPIDDKTVLLGDPALAEKMLAEKDSGAQEAPQDTQDSPERRSHEKLLESYAHAKRQLEEKGFKVERVPILHDEKGYTITYNNVLMEVRNGKRVVYMPAYGVKELDSAAAKKYESLGFEVRPVDVAEIYRFGGTLRCVTNVLARRDGKSSAREGTDEDRDSLQPQERLQQLP
jgi:N-dimethylarginine dimethylaminohydrolase